MYLEQNKENSMEQTPMMESVGETQNTNQNQSRETTRIHKSSAQQRSGVRVPESGRGGEAGRRTRAG
jgi:hypothetical protein